MGISYLGGAMRVLCLLLFCAAVSYAVVEEVDSSISVDTFDDVDESDSMWKSAEQLIADMRAMSAHMSHGKHHGKEEKAKTTSSKVSKGVQQTMNEFNTEIHHEEKEEMPSRDPHTAVVRKREHYENHKQSPTGVHGLPYSELTE